jgi:hypothetical protein
MIVDTLAPSHLPGGTYQTRFLRSEKNLAGTFTVLEVVLPETHAGELIRVLETDLCRPHLPSGSLAFYSLNLKKP